MPRTALLVLLLSLGSVSALQAQGAPPAADPAPAQKPPSAQQQEPQQPRDLMVAPSPGEKTPEPTSSNPGIHSAGVPANVCGELVAFFQRKAAEAAAPADPTKAGQGSGSAQQGSQTAGPGQTAPPMDQVQQRSGLSAPVPQDAKTSGATHLNLEQAQKLAQGNDLRGCQSAAQQMRRAGVSLPAGLLALAALREDLLARSQPPAPAPVQPPGGR
jgi:hypothetical protein